MSNDYFLSAFTIDTDMEVMELRELIKLLMGVIVKRVHITEDGVRDGLKGMPISGTRSTTSRHCGNLEETVEPQEVIFVLLMVSDEVPEDWRMANVVPLFEKEYVGGEQTGSTSFWKGRWIRDRSDHGFVHGK